MGCPNHFGGPTRTAKKFIDKLGKLDLKEKMVSLFDTYMSKDFEKALKKMEKRLNEKAPGLKLLTSGLSIEVAGVKGPIVEEDLPKCREFGKEVATQIKG